jgi:hypothetical protein
MDEESPSKALGAHTWTQTCKGPPSWTLCKKDYYRTIKTKQEPVGMSDGTTFLLLEVTPLQTLEIGKWPSL